MFRTLFVIILLFVALMLYLEHEPAPTPNPDVEPSKACLAATEEYNATGYWAGFLTLRTDPDSIQQQRFEDMVARAKERMHKACGTELPQ